MYIFLYVNRSNERRSGIWISWINFVKKLIIVEDFYSGIESRSYFYNVATYYSVVL